MNNTSQIASAGLIGMLHEMKNPLTSIKLCMELLENGNDELKENCYAIIKKSTEVLETSIRDISHSFVEEVFAVHINMPVAMLDEDI